MVVAESAKNMRHGSFPPFLCCWRLSKAEGAYFHVSGIVR